MKDLTIIKELAVISYTNENLRNIEEDCDAFSNDDAIVLQYGLVGGLQNDGYRTKIYLNCL